MRAQLSLEQIRSKLLLTPDRRREAARAAAPLFTVLMKAPALPSARQTSWLLLHLHSRSEDGD